MELECKQKIKGKKGFPRFKKRHGKQSFKIKQNIHLVEGKLVFPKFLDGIEIVQHREVEGNRSKAKKKLAKLYLKVTNKREDHLHKLSRRIINENQVICCEDLSVESMLAKVSPDERDEVEIQG